MNTKKEKVHYLPSAERTKIKREILTPFHQLPVSVKESYKTSLENAVISAIERRLPKYPLTEEEIIVRYVNPDFIDGITKHMYNKAKYGVKWSNYKFELPKRDYERLIVRYVINCFHSVKKLENPQSFEKRKRKETQEHMKMKRKDPDYDQFQLAIDFDDFKENK